MRVVFAGSAEFSLPILRALAASDQEVVKVLTAPDRAGSRGAAAPRPVRAAADSLGIPVAQPPRLTEEVWREVSYLTRADVLVVAAYGQLIPLSVLDSLRQGGLGVHPSLLPRHRGASPVVSAILAGDTRTGVTVFRMEQNLDSGPILGQAELSLGGVDTNTSLTAKLAALGGDVVVQVLRRLEAGGVTEIAQLESAATYSHRLSRQDGQLDWTYTAEIIDRHMRALSPWPGVTIPLLDKRVKLLRGAPDANTEVASEVAPGEILEQGPDWILVQTIEGAYRVELIQPPGGPQMSPAAFYEADSGHPEVTPVPEVKAPRLLARNKRARHEYHILEQLEAGIELWGTEVRSLRQGGAQITEAYVRIERGQAWLHGAHIQPYEFGNRQNHEPGRSRRLLLHRRQIDHLAGAVKQPGVTLVPLDLHLSGNRVKVELALGRGKREYDKRQAIAEREARRQIERGMRRNWTGGV